MVKYLKNHYIPLIMLLMCSLTFNLLLLRKNAALKNYIDLIKTDYQLTQGTLVPTFNAKTLNGQTEEIIFSNSNLPTLLYIFAPECEGCERNLSNIKFLATHARDKCRIIGLSLTSNNLQSYVNENELPFPVYHELPFIATSRYKMGGTPQSILISPQRIVLNNWLGSYEGSLKKEIEGYFLLQLPPIQNK